MKHLRHIAALLVSWLVLLAFFSPVRADLASHDTKVVWESRGRLYLASRDSLTVAPGDSVTFFIGDEVVGRGEIARVYDANLAVASLTWGTISPASLDRLRVAIARTALLRPTLRVGFPSRQRNSPFFRIGSLAVRSPFDAYRVDSLSTHSYREVRTVAFPSCPETILVRLFDEEADEEIALERGELDIGVFWPGEISEALRGPPWHITVASRGMVLGTQERRGAGRSIDDPYSMGPFWAMDRDLFRGDLGLWRPGADPDSESHAMRPRPHYDVDSAWPAKSRIERYLNRRPGPPANAIVVRLAYVDSLFRARLDLATPAGNGEGDAFNVPGPSGRELFFPPQTLSFPLALRRTVMNIGPSILAGIVDYRPLAHP